MESKKEIIDYQTDSILKKLEKTLYPDDSELELEIENMNLEDIDPNVSYNHFLL